MWEIEEPDNGPDESSSRARARFVSNHVVIYRATRSCGFCRIRDLGLGEFSGGIVEFIIEIFSVIL